MNADTNRIRKMKPHFSEVDAAENKQKHHNREQTFSKNPEWAKTYARVPDTIPVYLKVGFLASSTIELLGND